MRKILLSFIAFAAIVSCSYDESCIELSAGLPSPTKVGLDSSPAFFWNTGDNVSVFYKGSTFNKAFTYKGDDGASSGTLRSGGKSSSKKALTVALAPYSSEVSLSENVLSAKIPSVQEGPFDPASALLVAASEDDNLCFECLSSFLAIKLECCSSAISVDKIELCATGGENIAGSVAVDMTSDFALSLSKGTDVVTMNNPFDLKKGESATAIFGIAPVLLSKGYSFKVYCGGEEKPKVFSYSDAVSADRGSMRTITGTLTQEAYVITVSFSSASAFTPALPTTSTVSSAGGDEYSFKNTDGKAYSIRVFDSSNGYMFNSTCLRINNGSATPYTGWIALPAVASRSLVQIGVKVQNADGKAFALSSTSAGGGDLLGAVTFPNDEMKYVNLLTTPRAGSVCYITGSSKNLQIKQMELYYE